MGKPIVGKLPILAMVMAWMAQALAEPPMHVDDAGTLGKGGMKLEGAWLRDDKERGGELVFGFAPIEHLEIGITAKRSADHDPNPSTKLHGTGIGLKWVPYQNETGWSLGLKIDLDRTRVDDRSNEENFTEKERLVTALATYRFESGQAVHLNLGATRFKAPLERETRGTWGLGFEQQLTENLKLTTEIFGEEQARPDKAIGLRYKIIEGLKVSGAVGRGNNRSFWQIGFAWEF